MANEKQIARYWLKHFSRLSKKGSAIVGRTLKIRRIEGDEIGYTSDNNIICLNPTHEYVPKDIVKATSFINGVACHEIGHQLFTDFVEYKKFLDKEFSSKTDSEKSIFHTIMNIVEDTSIEYWLGQAIGGHLIADLRYMVSAVFLLSPEIENSRTPFEQFISAMIDYGDVGLLKGSFTFPEAREIFFKVQPIYDSAIEEPNFSKRLYKALEIFDLSEPLWKEIVESSERMKELAELLKELGSSKWSEGDTKGEYSSDAAEIADKDDSTGEEIKERRRKVIKYLKSEKSEAESKSGASNGDTEEASSESGDKSDKSDGSKGKSDESEGKSDGSKGKSDEAEDKSDDKANGSGASEPQSDDKSTDNTESDADSGTNTESESDDSESNDGDGSSSDNGSSADEGADNGSDKSGDSGGDKPTAPQKSTSESNSGEGSKPAEDDNQDGEDLDYDHERKIICDSMVITEEEAKEILARYNEDIDDEFEKREEREEKESMNVENLPIVVKGKNYSCQNTSVVADSEALAEEYQAVCNKYSSDIAHMAARFKRIKHPCPEEKERRISGRLNVQRYASPNRTTRVFDKRLVPSNHDLAVFLLVDESGSMTIDDRYIWARNAAIVIAEACEKAGIPLYVMGFTADDSYDAEHYHYVRWHNNRKARIAMMSIHGRHNNFDGYSIRYASELLGKRPENNKLLIVVSDGMPACRSYCSLNEGLADAKSAVRVANQKMTVEGVAIGTCDKNSLKEIYGRNFVDNLNLNDLLTDLGKVIQKRLSK